MELFLIPALLLTGIVFLFLSAGGMQSARIAYGPSPMGNSSRPATKRTWFSHGSNASEPSRKQPEIATADILLAELLTEMLEFREQLSALREEIKALTVQNTPQAAAAERPRRARRAPAA